MPIRALLAGLVVLLLYQSVSAQKWGKISNEEWAMRAPGDYSRANVVVIFAKATLKVKREIVEVEYHYRMKILSPAGIDDVGDMEIPYHKDDKIKGFKAHTITPDEKKHKVEKKAIFLKEVGDWRTKTFSFPALEEGCIVEYRFRHVSERFGYLRPWFFQNKIYTIYSEFNVELALGFVYNVSYQKVPPQHRRPEEDELTNPATGKTISTYKWSMENLRPIKDEPYMSALDDYRSSLRFQIISFENKYVSFKYTEGWDKEGEDFQRWYLHDYCNKKKDVKKLAEEVTAGLTTQLEKSMAIHKYVSEQFKTSTDYLDKYFTREKMDGLLKEKIGSAAEKNILLADMHTAVGVPAWPVVISRRSHGKLDPGDPNLSQFDYIVAVTELDVGWEFLDASNRISPYGLLPPNCLTDVGLLVDGKESSLVKMTTKHIQSYRADVTRMFVSSDGTVACSTECRYSGYMAADYGRIYEEDDPDEFIEEYYLDILPVDYTLGDFNCELDSLDQFHLTLNYTADELAEQLDNNWIIKPVRYGFTTNPFESEKRYIPVDFQYPFIYHSIVEIYVDFAVDQSMLPEDITKEIEGTIFSRVSTVNDTCVVVAQKLEILVPEFRVGRYRQLKDLFDEVARASVDEVILTVKE